MLKLNDKPATVQMSELWAFGGQSLVFSIWRDGSIFFFFLFPVTLKHTSKGKIPSGSPVYLFCSLMTSQRVFLIQYDFSSLIP